MKTDVKKNKRDFIEDLARKAEDAAGQGNLKDLYQLTKRLAGKFQQTDKPFRDEYGNVHLISEDQLRRQAEHF